MAKIKKYFLKNGPEDASILWTKSVSWFMRLLEPDMWRSLLFSMPPRGSANKSCFLFSFIWNEWINSIIKFCFQMRYLIQKWNVQVLNRMAFKNCRICFFHLQNKTVKQKPFKKIIIIIISSIYFSSGYNSYLVSPSEAATIRASSRWGQLTKTDFPRTSAATSSQI